MSEGLSRRSFLKLAATASAAAAIPGCEPAARKLIPYVVPDEYVTPGEASYYATSCTECSAGCGIIAKIREGRVIKLEGNPNDPISAGGICARGQAGLQGLYNPDRLSKPQVRGDSGLLRNVSWTNATKQLNDQLGAAAKTGKNRVVYIGAPQGPTNDKIVKAWLQAWGSQQAIFWEPLTDENARQAAQLCFGTRDLPTYRFDQAETIISFHADFLSTWRSPVEHARQYAEFRAPKKKNGELTIGRAVYVGPRLNTTAGKADRWVKATPVAVGAVAMSVLNVVVNQGWAKPNTGIDTGALKNFIAGYEPEAIEKQTRVPAVQIKEMAQWFGQADSAVAVADTDDVQAHLAAYLLNAVTGNIGKTMTFLAGAPPEATTRPEDTRAIIDSMRNGDVDVLVIAAGANPIYSMPPSYGFREATRRVKFIAWMGDAPDDSAAIAHLLLPTHHPLETWRDAAPRAGINALGQPVMQPVFPSKPLADILIASAHLGAAASAKAIPWESGQDAVNSEWQNLQNQVDPNANFADFWDKARANGGVYREAKAQTPTVSGAVFKKTFAPPQETGLTLVAYAHPLLYDGRGANKSWLQEIPEPVDQIVWDSWAAMHPETAASLGFSKNYLPTYLYAGIDVVELDTPNGPVRLGVHITPLVQPGVITVPIGQGHTSYGRYASGRGVNMWQHLPLNARSVQVSARKIIGEQHKLVSPLNGSDMMGRSIVEGMSVEELAKGIVPPREGPKIPEPYEMYEPFEYSGHKWGMTVDVNACSGCSACVAACYAENNLAIVGKDGVDHGRVMSWLRLERFIPEPEKSENAPLLYMSPIMCQQCDHAPCEPVCPVFASHHTPEGLNAQIYNRCIGTRFCENNCPYKVRRFNWFLPEWPAPLNLQLNPDVTTRGAGVMEKCTFCIQRITYAEIRARTEERPVKDGEIIPACAQACPSRAITFGDINDPNSAMMRRRKENHLRNYTMLPEFNALPNVTYLRALRHAGGRA
jgi:anaerobic selenocysteine-containing dehydrogenase/Fe-S-cluster-containing dehydrogenase component